MKGVDVRLLANKQKEREEINVKESPWNFLNKDIRLFGNLLNSKIKEEFYLELHMLLSAGIDISSALDLIISENGKEAVRSGFTRIREDIIKGASLSDALKSSGYFSEYEYFNIKIGEETGRLSDVLKELADYYKKRIAQRRQLITALTYPAIVTTFAFLAVVFMLNFVVPMFADVFQKFGSELPAITRIIIRMSDFLRGNIWIIIITISSVVCFFWRKRKTTWFKMYSQTFVLRIPVIGKLLHKIYLARFCNAMNLMLSSRITILRAIVLSRQMIDFYPLSNTFYTIEKNVLAGRSLHESMSEFKIFPAKMISLIKAGEEVNQLDFFLKRLYQQYSEETDHQVKVLGNMLEPVIIIVLGLLIGVILIAMYLPLFQLGQSL